MVHQSVLFWIGSVQKAVRVASVVLAHGVKSLAFLLVGSCWYLPATAQSLDSIRINDALQGELLLCGGGDLPSSLLSEFHSRGHGDRLVVIPTASRYSDSGDFTRWRQAWDDFNWRSIDILHAETREQAEEESLVEVLRAATAVWISGGDQSRLADRYLGSRVEQEIRGVMKRGGIVGGTSAGSAVVTKIMITGGGTGKTKPQINQGLDLLPKAIVDQHFTQRARQNRLAHAVASHPDRIGIGIDEGTALHITSKEAKVLGHGAVYVYKSNTSTQSFDEQSADPFANFDHKRFTKESLIAVDDLPLLCQ